MNKKTQYLTLIAVIAILLSGLAQAVTVSIANPAASGRISGAGQEGIGNQQANVTVDEVVNMTSVEVWAYSAGLTANTSSKFLGTNTSPGNDSVWVLVNLNTTLFEDGADYVFQANVTNDTTGASGQVGNDTNTGVTIDNTAPTAPTLLRPTLYQDDSNNITIRGDVTGGQTTSCTLKINQKTFTMTYSGDLCERRINIFQDIGESSYTYEVTASDGLNTSVTKANLNIERGSGSAVRLQIAQQQQDAAGQATGGGTNRNVLFLIGAAVLLWLVFGKK